MDYLFARTCSINSRFVEKGRVWAEDFGDLTRELTGQTVSVHRVALGSPGAITWSMPVETYGHLNEIIGVLESSESYRDIVDNGAEFSSGPCIDTLVEVMTATKPGATMDFHMVTGVSIGGGQSRDAVIWAAEVSEYVSELTGLPALFGRSSWGAGDRLMWLLAMPDAARVDAVTRMLRTDLGYLKRLDQGTALLRDGATTRRLFQRIA